MFYPKRLSRAGHSLPCDLSRHRQQGGADTGCSDLGLSRGRDDLLQVGRSLGCIPQGSGQKDGFNPPGPSPVLGQSSENSRAQTKLWGLLL